VAAIALVEYALALTASGAVGTTLAALDHLCTQLCVRTGSEGESDASGVIDGPNPSAGAAVSEAYVRAAHHVRALHAWHRGDVTAAIGHYAALDRHCCAVRGPAAPVAVAARAALLSRLASLGPHADAVLLFDALRPPADAATGFALDAAASDVVGTERALVGTNLPASLSAHDYRSSFSGPVLANKAKRISAGATAHGSVALATSSSFAAWEQRVLALRPAAIAAAVAAVAANPRAAGSGDMGACGTIIRLVESAAAASRVQAVPHCRTEVLAALAVGIAEAVALLGESDAAPPFVDATPDWTQRRSLAWLLVAVAAFRAIGGSTVLGAMFRPSEPPAHPLTPTPVRVAVASSVAIVMRTTAAQSDCPAATVLGAIRHLFVPISALVGDFFDDQSGTPSD
jgi:hypothetical protein